jgi:Flp pilus assembly protein TadD
VHCCRYEQASTTLGEVLRLQPKNAKANFLYGLCLEERGSHVEAERKFAYVATMDPSFANSLVEASHRASKLKQIPQAIKFLQQALRLLPMDDGLNLELGRLLTTVHDHTGAVKAFGKCIEHAPHVPTYQLERGRSNFAGVR